MSRFKPFLLAIAVNIGVWITLIIVITFLYFTWLRDYQMNWGATDNEISQYMAGDELLEDPELNATRAVEIKAPPEKVWPWIVQMGYGRAGFYSFDNIDNGGVPSAKYIIPEYQNLKVGDSIPGGKYKGRIFNLLGVVTLEPNKSMLWVFAEGTVWQNATWSWGLYKTDRGHTRLVSRLRQKYDRNSFGETFMWSLVDVMEVFMMRTTLLGIKLRADNK